MGDRVSRLLIILYTLDSFVLAVLTLGSCRIGETISSVAFSLESDGKWRGRVLRPTIDTLFFFDRDHCHGAWVTFRKVTGQIR